MGIGPANLRGYIMVKVLIYGSKEIYDAASYEGRAESDIVAYRRDDGYYQVVKNRSRYYMGSYTTFKQLQQDLNWIESDEWDAELKSHKLTKKYKLHPNFELMKNGSVAELV